MGWRGALARAWAVGSMALVAAVIVFLFGYVFYRGGSVVSWEFLTESPSGAVLGEEGGIWPAVVGSLWFTGVAVVIGGVPALACALWACFFCRSERLVGVVRTVVRCIAGIPSIVLGLFAYSLLVRDAGLGRCILSTGVALGIMILPFVEQRAEKAFQELPPALLASSSALGCSRRYTVTHIVLPACWGELVSGLVLGGCYAMGATAPMMFTGAVAYASVPTSVLEPAMALPMHLYLLVSQGATSLDTAFGTALVMMAVVLAGSLLAMACTLRSQRKWQV